MAFSWSDTAVPTSSGADLRDFAEDTGHAVLCAVGSSGLVYTTPDGVTWTKRTAAAANAWRAVAYSPGLNRLVAVSSNGTNRVMYSDDGGVTWTSASASEANGWQGIVWASWLGGGTFVAVASGGTHRVMTSTDGITWTNQTAAAAKAWDSVACSGTTLVAVCSTSGTTQSVMTSTDAVTWTMRTTGAANSFQRGVSCGSSALAYSPSLGMFAYVAQLDSGGAWFVNTSTNNGTTWTAAALPTSRVWGGIRWLSSAVTFAIVENGYVGSFTFVAMSTDGVTWTETDTGINVGGAFFDCMGWMDSTSVVAAWDQGGSTHMLVGGPPTPGITPNTGFTSGGLAVAIVGTGFVAGATVSFGKYFGSFNEATDVVIVDANNITCKTPPFMPAEVVTVIVTNPDASTPLVLLNSFTYTAPSMAGGPGSFSIAPDHGPMAGGTVVTITGDSIIFSASPQVLFGGSPATSVSGGGTGVLVCTTPAHTPETVDVTIYDS